MLCYWPCYDFAFMPARRPYLSREGSSAKFSLDGTRTTNMPQSICQAIIQMECTMHVWSKVLTVLSDKHRYTQAIKIKRLLATWRVLFASRAPPWCCQSVPPHFCLQTKSAHKLTCSTCFQCTLHLLALAQRSRIQKQWTVARGMRSDCRPSE